MLREVLTVGVSILSDALLLSPHGIGRYSGRSDASFGAVIGPSQ